MAMSVELIFCTGPDDADSRVGDGPLESARPMTPSATSLAATLRVALGGVSEGAGCASVIEI